MRDENYKCDFCIKEFTSKSHLIAHKRSFHENEKHECNTCGKIFTYKGTLKIHIKKVHIVSDPSLTKRKINQTLKSK